MRKAEFSAIDLHNIGALLNKLNTFSETTGVELEVGTRIYLDNGETETAFVLAWDALPERFTVAISND